MVRRRRKERVAVNARVYVENYSREREDESTLARAILAAVPRACRGPSRFYTAIVVMGHPISSRRGEGKVGLISEIEAVEARRARESDGFTGTPMNSPPGNRYYSSAGSCVFYFAVGGGGGGGGDCEGSGEREVARYGREEYKRLAGRARELECRPVISGIYRRGCNHKSCSIE